MKFYEDNAIFDLTFDVIFEKLDSAIIEINEEGRQAFLEGRYTGASRISEIGTELVSIKKMLEDLKSQWNCKIDKSTNEVSNQEGKRNKTKLNIKFEDGRTLQCSKATDSFVETIKKFGIDKVKNLNLHVRGIPLVSHVRSNKYVQRKVGQYYLITHSSTREKKEIIEKISQKLNMPVRVEIIY